MSSNDEKKQLISSDDEEKQLISDLETILFRLLDRLVNKGVIKAYTTEYEEETFSLRITKDDSNSYIIENMGIELVDHGSNDGKWLWRKYEFAVIADAIAYIHSGYYYGEILTE